MVRCISSETVCVRAARGDDRGMHRLFVALRPPPPIRAMLLATMDGVDRARWQDDDQVHVTVRYIGEVDARTADEVATALARIVADRPMITVAGVGHFEKRGRTDSLWAALAPRPILAALHAKVDRACVVAGLGPDTRAYVPHVTLARLPRSGHDERQVERWLADHAGLRSAPFAPSHLILYESHLAPDGATYDAVMRWPLGTAATANGSPA